MKKLLLLLTLFLPLIAMESDQPKKMSRLQTEEYGPHAFQPAEKRRKTVERPEDLIYPLPEIQEIETFRSSLTKMSIAFLTQRSPQTIEQEHIASAPVIEEAGLIAEAENPSSPAIIDESELNTLKKTDAYTISQHAKKIGNSYECPECKRLIKHERKKLILHILTHTGERPFPCTYPGCDKSFAQKTNLIMHIRTHTGERSYSCTYPGCGKAFAQKINLITHTGERPFTCTYPDCGKSFARKTHLIAHTRTHTKPFKCHHCDSAFSYEAGLQKHIKKEHQMEN